MESDTVGRKEEIKMIFDKIRTLDGDNREIRVYGIWGMAGVGKTHLARAIYADDDKVLDKYFDFKYWVKAPSNFQVQPIITEILCHHGQYLDVSKKSLQNILRGKRFLIVLDDVAIEEDEKFKWDELKETLSCGKEGSIVVVTTRYWETCRLMAEVAELQHHLQCLSEEDSWLLLKKFAFRERVDISDMKQNVVREIVKKYELGLPGALKDVGMLLYGEEVYYWVIVFNIWELVDKIIVLKILLSSYQDLRPHERKCFTYFSLFPKGYHMKKDMVISLWVASDLIPLDGGRDLYEHGQQIFNLLLGKSFIEQVKNNKYSNIERYKLNGLMHSMARHVMGNDFLFIESHERVKTIPNEALHLISSSPDCELSPQELKSLRSVFVFGEDYKFRSINQIFKHKCLRVLYLCGIIGLWTLPESICELKHLTYLNLSYSSIEFLPDSIIDLQNLQMLLLNFCYELCKLPEGLRRMTSLQILEINSCDSLLYLPTGIKELTGLQRLTRFPVGNEVGAKLEELKDLNGLEGGLEITSLENVKDRSEASSALLKEKSKISVLKLSWSSIYLNESKRETFKNNDEEVLQGLKPNRGLKELRISFYAGNTIYPIWIYKLQNLVEIGFSGCKRCECIPPLGILANLRVIKLLGMDSLEGFHKEDGSKDDPFMFPGLQELSIFMCPKLVSLPDQSLKGLKKLEIIGCKHLSRRYEEDKGADRPKISHIPDIRIDPPSN